jgi:hypothetical protein
VPNDNTIGGYYADKATMLGPSAATINAQRPNDMNVPGRDYLADAPVYGPITRPANGRGLPTPRQFVSSPVGMLTLGGVGAYLLFRYVFA